MPRRPEKKNIEIYPRLIKLPPPATLHPYVQIDFLFTYQGPDLEDVQDVILWKKHAHVFRQEHFI